LQRRIARVAHERDLDDEPDEQRNSDRERQQGSERVPPPRENRGAQRSEADDGK
jgi:hypothetical protein